MTFYNLWEFRSDSFGAGGDKMRPEPRRTWKQKKLPKAPSAEEHGGGEKNNYLALTCLSRIVLNMTVISIVSWGFFFVIQKYQAMKNIMPFYDAE